MDDIMRILSVGWEIEGPGVERASLHDADSLAGYEVVLIDPGEISGLWLPYVAPDRDGVRRLVPGYDQGLSRALENLFSARKEELAGLLRSGGIVAVRLRPPGEGVEIAPHGGPPRRLDAYSFLPNFSLTRERQFLPFPQGIRIFPRRGRDLRDLDLLHPLSGYLSAVRRYEAVIVSPTGVPLGEFGRVLLRNRIGDILAWELELGRGRLLFLPSSDLSPRAAGEALIPGLLALLDEPLPSETLPDWLSRYSLPQEEPIRKELEEIAQEEEKLSKRRAALEGRLREMNAVKGLLFPTGTMGLVRAGKRAFRVLGFEVEGDELDPQSFRIEAPEGRAMVRGAWSPEGAVTTGAYRPLLLALDHLRLEKDEAIHGVMLVAADTSRDPKRRGPRYTESLRRACEEHGISLVTGEDLFEAVRAVLGGADPVPVRRSLLSASGPWKWRA